MEVKLIYHGKLAELMKFATEPFHTEALTAADLSSELLKLHPELANSTFQLAQKNAIISGHDPISEGTIDIFPPFSGG
ncbi:MAG: hypothetical protein CMC35_06235 [Flavobacteriaceae bacterium]|nr:hypothetical protein [Flavobacteriaceae bacterium]|tara:strand:- start:15057 stop:15290 length:234 start_codon:yes stop_codon:yes gene_type:complete